MLIHVIIAYGLLSSTDFFLKMNSFHECQTLLIHIRPIAKAISRRQISPLADKELTRYIVLFVRKYGKIIHEL